MLLTDKTCLITGGGTGIGRATAFRFAEEGAEVWIAGIDSASIEATAKEIGSRCTGRIADVTKEEEMGKLVGEMPKLDVLVANAGISYSVDPVNDPLDRWRQMVEVNMWGAVVTCRAGARRMIAQKQGGRIVIVSSILSGLAEPGSAHYGMAKAALNQLGRQLAVEWAEHGILVNVVVPGFVLTPMSFASGSNEYESEWFNEFFVNAKRPRLPLMRPGRPEELAEAILFFANPRNTYCTGSLLTVDGGVTARF